MPAWNGHDAALSWTFDDGFASHTDVVSPLFNQLGIEVTFYPTCQAIVFDPDAWQAVAAAGHEIANHTMTHAVAGPDTDPAEIEGCDTVLNEVIGAESATFAYPNGVVDEPYYSYTQAHQVAARGTAFPQQHIRANSTFDWYAIPGIALGEERPTDDADEAEARPIDGLASAVEQRGWLSLIIHAIDEPGYARIPLSELQTVLDASLEYDFWQATFADVATHLRLQQVFRTIVPEAIDGGWHYAWTPVTGMTDVPIRVALTAGRIEQDGTPVATEDGFALIDARVGGFDWFAD